MGPGWGGQPPHPGLGPPSPLASPSAARPRALRGKVPAAAPPRSLPPPVSAGPCGRCAWGLWGPGGLRCPGPEVPSLGGEAGSADAGSGSTWVAPLAFPAPLSYCEVPDPQESELRNPSKVLLPGGCSRLGASAGGDRGALNLNPTPAVFGLPYSQGAEAVPGTRGGHLQASPGD